MNADPAAHIGFAYSVADAIHRKNRRFDRDELRAEALVGLVEAARRYDPENAEGANFLTYATYWVRSTVFKFMAMNHSLVCLNTNLYWRARRVRQGRTEASEELGMQRLSASRQELVVQHVAAPDRYMYEAIAPGETRTLAETLADEKAEAAVTAFGDDEYVDHVTSLLGGVRPIEREILHETVFADELVPYTAIADRHGLSRERVRQIRNRLLRRIYECSKAESNGIELPRPSAEPSAPPTGGARKKAL